MTTPPPQSIESQMTAVAVESDPTGSQSSHDRSSLHSGTQSRLISKVLSPAIRLWLRAQAESIATLDVELGGGDRQILTGHIPHVTIAATDVIYQGLALSQLRLSAQGIRINIGQVLKGKPLRLLAVVPVAAELQVRQTDLSTSLQSPLLTKAITDILVKWVRSVPVEHLPAALHPLQKFCQHMAKATLDRPAIQLGPQQITLSGCLRLQDSPPEPIAPEQPAPDPDPNPGIPFSLQTGLSVTGAMLRFHQPVWTNTRSSEAIPLKALDGFEVYLGSDVELETFILQPDRLFCTGQININP